MLNRQVLKCHEDLITLEKYTMEKQWIISFSYVKTLTTLAIRGWVGGWGEGLQ